VNLFTWNQGNRIRFPATVFQDRGHDTREKTLGTKNNPGKWDCHSNAEPDKPLFTLLARDPTAEFFVAAWAAVRAGDVDSAGRLMRDAVAELVKVGKQPLPYNSEKSVEAQQCAKAMRTWRHMRQMDEIEKRLSKESSATTERAD